MAASFPKLQTPDRILNQIQDNVARAIQPTLANPLTNGVLLTNVSLSAGSNTVNHTLDRTLQGWTVVRQRADASIYDTQDNNATPSLTLLLTSSDPVTCDLFVF